MADRHPKFNLVLTKVLEYMFTYVGADFNNFNFDQKDWCLTQTWTEQEQTDFRNWLANHLMTNKEARIELARYPRSINKQQALKFSEQFVLNYGWKVEG